jgi:hypothetical protein
MANQSPQGRLQPRVQQYDSRLFSSDYGSRRSDAFTIRLVDDLVDSLKRMRAPSPRAAI